MARHALLDAEPLDPRRVHDIDRHVGARMRERRIIMQISQQDLARLIGVSYQQVYKYESGMNRVSAGRLSQIARALGVREEYFFQDLPDCRRVSSFPEHRATQELARNFVKLSSRHQQEALCILARVMADQLDEANTAESSTS